jgi:hypothetical protein
MDGTHEFADGRRMTLMRSVFDGTPAFLGRIDGRTRCAVWTDEPVDHDFDPQRRDRCRGRVEKRSVCS